MSTHNVTRVGLPCASTGAAHVLLQLSTSLFLAFLFFFLNFRYQDILRFLSLLFFNRSSVSTYRERWQLRSCLGMTQLDIKNPTGFFNLGGRRAVITPMLALSVSQEIGFSRSSQKRNKKGKASFTPTSHPAAS